MAYFQKSLIELFKAGKFPGETGRPKHIETVISNVFIFETKVYKFYKNDNSFFNKGFRDISAKNDRFEFTRRDFQWNKLLSPSIYLDLVGVMAVDGQVKIVESDNVADELVFVMHRVDIKDVLFEKLMAGQVTAEDCFSIGKQFAMSMERIQKPVSVDKNYYKIFQSRILDLREWIKSVNKYISDKESGEYCDYLDNFINKNKKLFETQLTKEITVDGDFHSHNAIYSNGTLFLMDTFPPKDEWGIGHSLIPLYRVGVDIWALTGKPDFFENFVRGYDAGIDKKVDRSLDDFYIVYASGIAVSYLYMLQTTDPGKKIAAEKFHKFLRDYFVKIK